jgi:hypothetical protein
VTFIIFVNREESPNLCTSGLINSSGKQIDKIRKEKATPVDWIRGSFYRVNKNNK